MSVLASVEAPTGPEAVPGGEPNAQNLVVPPLVNRQGVPRTSEQIAALDDARRREPEHPDTLCSPGWCLVKPLIRDRRVWAWDGYHRSDVRSIHVRWGLTMQVGLGQSAEGSEPVVHLRALENDCNGDQPYDVVMSPDDALEFAARPAETPVGVRREITYWHAATGGER